MKKTTYRILTSIPVVGSIIKDMTYPIVSSAKGLDNLKRLSEEYPEEQITQQFMIKKSIERLKDKQRYEGQ